MLLNRFDVPVAAAIAAQVAVAEDVAQARPRLSLREALAGLAVLVDVAIRRRFLAPDQEHEDGRDAEADRVDAGSRSAPSAAR